MVADPLEAFVKESLERSLSKGYPARVFRRMLGDYGTVEAMRRLAEADVLQTGLLELAKRDLLEWSVEAGVLRFPDRFPERLTQASAQFKLDQARRGMANA
jgi:hypothetical protein